MAHSRLQKATEGGKDKTSVALAVSWAPDKLEQGTICNQNQNQTGNMIIYFDRFTLPGRFW